MIDVDRLATAGKLNAAQIVAHAGSGEPEKMHEYINQLSRQDLAWVVLALTAQVLDFEAENGDLYLKVGSLTQQFERAENSNIALFAERRRLTDKVAELRSIIYARQQGRVNNRKKDL